MDETWIVRYIWQGETLRHSQDFDSADEAEAIAEEMRRAKWRAWAELLT